MEFMSTTTTVTSKIQKVRRNAVPFFIFQIMYDVYMNELQRKGLKTTKNREVILACIKKLKKPFTIPELLNLLDKENIDQVTVYRTINSFKENDMVREIWLAKSNLHYEYNHGHHHHHFVCSKCGTVEDIDICIPQKTLTDVLKKNTAFASITGHSFELFGICKKCFC